MNIYFMVITLDCSICDIFCSFVLSGKSTRELFGRAQSFGAIQGWDVRTGTRILDVKIGFKISGRVRFWDVNIGQKLEGSKVGASGIGGGALKEGRTTLLCSQPMEVGLNLAVGFELGQVSWESRRLEHGWFFRWKIRGVWKRVGDTNSWAVNSVRVGWKMGWDKSYLISDFWRFNESDGTSEFGKREWNRELRLEITRVRFGRQTFLGSRLPD